MTDELVLITASGAIVVLAGYVLYMVVLDTPGRRRRIAARLVSLGHEYRDTINYGRTESTSIPEGIIISAESRDRFTSCYAINLLGSLARDFPDRPEMHSTVRIISRQLASEDPFVRHAAAEVLFLLGTHAQSAAEALRETQSRFPKESSGLLAARALENMDAQMGH